MEREGMKIKLERLKCEYCDGGGMVGRFEPDRSARDWHACPKCNRSGLDGYRISDETLRLVIFCLDKGLRWAREKDIEKPRQSDSFVNPRETAFLDALALLMENEK